LQQCATHSVLPPPHPLPPKKTPKRLTPPPPPSPPQTSNDCGISQNLASIGEEGSGPCQFRSPAGVCVDSQVFPPSTSHLSLSLHPCPSLSFRRSLSPPLHPSPLSPSPRSLNSKLCAGENSGSGMGQPSSTDPQPRLQLCCFYRVARQVRGLKGLKGGG
jgi:hypothetical protein